MMKDKSVPLIDSLHLEACKNGQPHYIDPATGYRVFTSVSLQSRRSCCGCGCRHCPFGHELVDPTKKQRLRQDPWIEENQFVSGPCDVLSWSGGKDSFLALLELSRSNRRPVVLMTTFDGRSHQVAHQEVQLNVIRLQAKQLGLNLLLVPLYPESDYCNRIQQGIQHLLYNNKVIRMVFGDLHLEHVRRWRLEMLLPSLQKLDIELCFPLWKKPYSTLLADFVASGASATISAVADPRCLAAGNVGDPFGSNWIDRLPDELDSFGENGEFHTLVRPPFGGWKAMVDSFCVR